MSAGGLGSAVPAGGLAGSGGAPASGVGRRCLVFAGPRRGPAPGPARPAPLPRPAAERGLGLQGWIAAPQLRQPGPPLPAALPQGSPSPPQRPAEPRGEGRGERGLHANACAGAGHPLESVASKKWLRALQDLHLSPQLAGAEGHDSTYSPVPSEEHTPLCPPKQASPLGQEKSHSASSDRMLLPSKTPATFCCLPALSLGYAACPFCDCIS